jgi:hypothetical protein
VYWLQANASKLRVMSVLLGFFFGVFLDLPLGGCFVTDAGPRYQGLRNGCANIFGQVLSGPRLAAPLIVPVVAFVVVYLVTAGILAIGRRR